jgi:hypothetical protein
MGGVTRRRAIALAATAGVVAAVGAARADDKKGEKTPTAPQGGEEFGRRRTGWSASPCSCQARQYRISRSDKNCCPFSRRALA